ncbi:class III poly(R)-hydroxyalkanoic acid synthase subunit PhaE [Luteimonas aquatica]|uniref:class III poly(R)-hydroxyalkanoic acid synthase subunit PhaE n=1 Tax=Luteimonas aquatica TaxID=450364 RepID=UPI001F56904D|nr:class III poly(R)-hydroxyalkanoic acid synthase subunit PhaE [Luteimonas aquatica]
MRDGNEGGAGAPDGFEALTRQYWKAWNEALRGMASAGGLPPRGAPASPWQAALEGWAAFAQGGVPEANDAVGRLRSQAGHWFAQMQQLAGQFAGGDAGAHEIAQAWKRMLGAAGGNPFSQFTGSMHGQGAQSFERWLQQAAPWMNAFEGFRHEGAAWLQLPTFGLAREHQERWQRLAQAHLDYQQRTQDYNTLMLKATEDAYALFERKLSEHADAGRKIETARALFDLWVDAAEDAYARIALSREFRQVYAGMVDAQMRLRGGIQREVEQACALLDMPTRSELDGAHRKIVELERQVRRLREAQGRAPSAARAAASAPPQTATPAPRVVKAPARRAAGKKPASKKPAVKPAGRKSAAKAAHDARSIKRGPLFAMSGIAAPMAPEPMTERETAHAAKGRAVKKHVAKKKER